MVAHSRSSLSEGVFQVAYVVHDMQAAQRFFNEMLGGPRFFVIENIAFKEHTYRGQPVECHQHVAFGYAGSMQIELIQQLSGENTVSEFLHQHGHGVHHLGIQVADLDRATHDMTELGFALVESGVAGHATRFAFLDTRAAISTYIELVSLDEDNRALFERIRRGDFQIHRWGKAAGDHKGPLHPSQPPSPLQITRPPAVLPGLG
jgi:methylmalonyl-CoA/ethylmalonyl-CoA epimerase